MKAKGTFGGSPGQRPRGRALLEGVLSFAWVLVVSVLVWVYADLEFTRPHDVRAVLRIRTGPEAVLLGSGEVPLVFSVRANNHLFDRFMERLSASGGVLTYDASAMEPGTHRERTVDVLAQLPEVRELGLEVVSCQTRLLELKLDTLKTMAGVPVRFEYSGGVLDGPATIDPDKVDLRVPASQVRLLPGDAGALAVRTETLDLRDIPSDEEVRRSLELLPPAGLTGARLSRSRAEVTFRIAQPTASKKFIVTVKVQSPKSWLEDDTWANLKVQAKPPEEWTRQITVLGNRIDLEKLRQDDISAYVALTEDDKQRVDLGSWWPGQVRVVFPPGLKVRLAESPAPVNYRLAKRQAPAPP